MDGYTYVQNVLKADNNDVSILLLKLKKRENSAVEFKASCLKREVAMIGMSVPGM